jgi:hypothetical protein
MDTNLETEMQTNFRDYDGDVADRQTLGRGTSDAMPCGIKNPLWVGYRRDCCRIAMAADISMVALGALSRVSNQSVIANTENRRTVPRIDSVERMAYAFGVSPTWFAFGSRRG